MTFLSYAELETCLDQVRQSPRNGGTVSLIVRRPKTDERELLDVGELDPQHGLVGDKWGRRTENDDTALEYQITLMNSRAIAHIAQDRDRWPLAGDQFFVDFDLSEENIPAGTRLTLGTAIIEVTATPHTGCKKFAARFGTDSVKFVNSPLGKQLHLRGVNAKVVKSGTVRVGDVVQKL